jgi:diguanylate cyclase (GGDEF)-like protein
LSFAVADRLTGTRDGLPAAQVIALCEDRTGALWVGTTGGLARLSGPEIQTFGVADGLPRPVVTAIEQGPDGTLFAGTRSGIARFDPRTQRFLPEPPPADGLRVRSLAQGPAGTLWALLGEDTIIVLRNRIWRPVPLARTPAFEALALAIDGFGDVWLATRRSGLLHLQHEGEGLGLVHAFGGDEGFRGGEASFVIRDGLGITAAGADALVSINPTGIRSIPYPEGYRGGHRTLARAPDGRLYVGFDAGLVTVDPKRREARPLQSLRDAARLPAARLLVDRAGNLWAGTIDRGLALFSTGAGIEYLRAPGQGPGLLFKDDRGTYWAATNDALYRFHRGEGGDMRDAVRVRTEGVVPSGYTAVSEDDGGGLLFGAGEGVTLVSAATREAPTPILRKDPRFDALEAAFAGRIVKDRAGTVWVGSGRGLYSLTSGGSKATLVPLPGLAQGLRLPSVDRTGAVWVSADNGGLWRIPSSNPRVAEKVALPQGSATLGYSTASLKGDLLLSFEDGSSTILDAGTRAPVTRVPADGALGRLAPESLVALSDGRILAAHGAGQISLVTLEPPRVEAPLLSAADLDGADPQYLSALAEADGSFWLSGLGVVAHVPASYRPPAVRPLLLDSARSEEGLLADGPVRLPPAPNAVDFVLALADPIAPRSVRYRWRLGNGPFSSWTNDPRVHLFDLPHGNFPFEAEAQDRFGRPASAPVRLSIVVAPRFYETVLFRLGALVAVGLLAFAWHRRHLGIAERESERLREAVRERTRDLAEANSRLAEASLTDSLTGLPNRRFLSSLVETLVPNVLRQRRDTGPRESLVCCLVDIDRFKVVNDTFGHATGDEVLVSTADALRRAARGSAAVVRWGGEEFLVVDRIWKADDGWVLAERLRRSVGRQRETLEDGSSITVSVGYAVYPFWEAHPEALSWEDVVRLADTALYRAKHDGRNRWGRAEPNPPALEALAHARGLDAALDLLKNDTEGAIATGLLVVTSSGGEPDANEAPLGEPRG